MSNKKELTVAEAISEGYTRYGFANREWQTTNDLEDLRNEISEGVDDVNWDHIVLFGKESSRPTINTKQIADLLAESIGEDDAQETGRDDDAVWDTILALNFDEVTNRINKALEQHEYWMLTDIKLIKEDGFNPTEHEQSK